MNTITRMIDGGNIHRRQLIKSTRLNQRNQFYNWTRYHTSPQTTAPMDSFKSALNAIISLITRVLPL